MTTAGVGGGENREETVGRVENEEGEVDDGGGWAVTAETSTSRGEEDVDGATRMRPSNPIEWSLSLSQHLLQMRLLIETSTCGSSCRVKTSEEGSG